MKLRRASVTACLIYETGTVPEILNDYTGFKLYPTQIEIGLVDGKVVGYTVTGNSQHGHVHSMPSIRLPFTKANRPIWITNALESAEREARKRKWIME